MIMITVAVIDQTVDDEGRPIARFSWAKQHGIMLTTDADPTDEVSYIAMLYAREAMKEWKRDRS